MVIPVLLCEHVAIEDIITYAVKGFSY